MENKIYRYKCSLSGTLFYRIFFLMLDRSLYVSINNLKIKTATLCSWIKCYGRLKFAIMVNADSPPIGGVTDEMFFSIPSPSFEVLAVHQVSQ